MRTGTSGAAGGFGRFPIPMRGNELVQRLMERMDGLVPNPHEG